MVSRFVRIDQTPRPTGCLVSPAPTPRCSTQQKPPPADSRSAASRSGGARRPSPAFKLKIETNLDAEGNYAAVQQVEASGLWNDPVVASKRIPREEVQVHQLIGQGAFGQVFSGSLRGDTVAVKKLRPETQQDDDHVDGFLAEVKVSAALNHPHIVQFVGVAWTSVSDLCVVQEFMEGGDLRSLLDRYEAERHAIGFDRQKTHIAMQICSALAYMHSLSPPVIHSNLKSRNVLLSGALEAKVTNFGTSP
ncbi:hypothetical protein PR003_g7128 [Phytophthora rubi]|uniref:Protein kinase domain-containing protein n=1 Tax=Phytophthora rubi TaxID=129364 RepID=A0A6A4G0U0_9STRA|nr:hypothetical protein PR003_g7128 [Phytophthora rubi]